LINLYNLLVSYKDENYLDFQSALVPNINKNTFIGVRTPILKNIAKVLNKQDAIEFTTNLPHDYFDENQLHAFIISNEKNFDDCIILLENFLPYIDN
jgi:3-methyladenine DNA glycosylase AlkD